MTSLSVGVDLMAVQDVADALAAFGDHYLHRVYTAAELADCTGSPASQAASLAARFAAKEATVKALRPVGGGVGWLDIELCRDEGGAPRLELHGVVSALAEERGFSELSVSISHHGPMAAAVVVAR